jgi:leucyl aminopeptidase
VYPAAVKYSVDKLEPYYKKISIPKMKAFLTKFSSFRNRYYRSSTGVESQQFLLATIRKIVGANPKLGITVEEFEHPWGQNSILVKIPPAKEVKKDEKIVILSAHQDSTNLLPFLPAPGADDDGSGTTTLITSLAILVNASFVPSTNPVELHFYSAEEGGLLGSAAVAQAYAAAGKKIRGQLQQVSPLPPTTSDSFYFC